MTSRSCESWDCQCGELNNTRDICSCGKFRSKGKVKRCEKWLCQCGTENVTDICKNYGCKKFKSKGEVRGSISSSFVPEWKCKCGTSNTVDICSNSNCKLFRSKGKVAEQNDWLCTSCNSPKVNFGSKKNCFTCKAPRESSQEASSSGSQIASPAVTNSDDTATCNICMSNPKNRSLAPCGHPLCADCADKIKAYVNYMKCPFCREEVTQIIPRYD
jgi:hypothetical protein